MQKIFDKFQLEILKFIEEGQKEYSNFLKEMKELMKWENEDFFVPQDVYTNMETYIANGEKAEQEWNE